MIKPMSRLEIEHYEDEMSEVEIVKALVVKRTFFPNHRSNAFDLHHQYRLIFKDKHDSTVEYHADPVQTKVVKKSSDYIAKHESGISYNEFKCSSHSNISGVFITSCSVTALPPPGITFDEAYLAENLLKDIDVIVPKNGHSLPMCQKKIGKYYTRNDLNKNIEPTLQLTDPGEYEKILERNRIATYAYKKTNSKLDKSKM